MARKPVVVVLWFVAVKLLHITDSLEFESVWCKITTPKSEYHVANSYLPPDPVFDRVDPLEDMSDPCWRSERWDHNCWSHYVKEAELKVRDSWFCPFNLQCLVIPKVNFFKKKIVLGRLINILQATWSEHALHDELVGAVDKDKGLLSVQSAVFFNFYL